MYTVPYPSPVTRISRPTSSNSKLIQTPTSLHGMPGHLTNQDTRRQLTYDSTTINYKFVTSHIMRIRQPHRQLKVVIFPKWMQTQPLDNHPDYEVCLHSRKIITWDLLKRFYYIDFVLVIYMCFYFKQKFELK